MPRTKKVQIKQDKTQERQEVRKRSRPGMVEFTLQLRDRNGHKRQLRGYVEEGTTRNDAVAQLIRENGGVCKIKEGEGDLAGLRWISRIELGSFKIEEWGQYATINGEFEIGKLNRSLAERLMAVFFKRFKEKAFWENGDTIRVSKNNNIVLFREDYGMKGELPQAELMLNSRRFRQGGYCGGAITKGELELVKLAARINFKREEYLVNLDEGKIRKRELPNELQYSLSKVFAPPEFMQFDAITKNTRGHQEHEIFWRINKLDSGKCGIEKMQDQMFSGNFFCDIGFINDKSWTEASSDLFFSKHEKIFSDFENEDEKKNEEKHEKKQQDAVAGRGEDDIEEESIEKEMNEKAKKRRKPESVERPVVQEERDKIFSIIRKLSGGKDSKNEKQETAVEDELPIKKDETGKSKKKNKKNIATEKTSGKTREKKDKKSDVYTKKPKKQPKKLQATKKIPKKQLEKNKYRKEHEKAREYGNARKHGKVRKISISNKIAKAQKPKSKENREKKEKIEKLNEKPLKIKKIKLKKIAIKTNQARKPLVKNPNPGYRKGAELAHRLFLKALKNIERRKRVAATLAIDSRPNGRLFHKKPGNKI